MQLLLWPTYVTSGVERRSGRRAFARQLLQPGDTLSGGKRSRSPTPPLPP